MQKFFSMHSGLIKKIPINNTYILEIVQDVSCTILLKKNKDRVGHNYLESKKSRRVFTFGVKWVKDASLSSCSDP